MKRALATILLLLWVFFLAIPVTWAWQDARAFQRFDKDSSLQTDTAVERITQSIDTNRFRFAVVGDIQIGAPMIPLLLRACAEQNVEFIVQTGDFSARPRKGFFGLTLRYWDAADVDIPALFLAGNHDVRESSRDEVPSPIFESLFGSPKFEFSIGEHRFISVDNSMDAPSDIELVHLRETLDGVAGRKFVFMHAQPIAWRGSGTALHTGLYKSLVETLVETKADYVFTGNWHGYHVEERDGITYIINGHGGDFDNDSLLAPGNITVVDVNGEEVSIKRVEVPRTIWQFAESYYTNRMVADVGARIVYSITGKTIAFVITLSVFAAVWYLAFKAGRPNPAVVG